MPAKLALAQLVRAIKKRDYMLLTSDAVPEIDQIKMVCPEISEYAEDIREMRQLQKSIFAMQFRRDSPDGGEQRPLFTLPQLPSKRMTRTNVSQMGSIESRANTR